MDEDEEFDEGSGEHEHILVCLNSDDWVDNLDDDVLYGVVVDALVEFVARVSHDEDMDAEENVEFLYAFVGPVVEAGKRLGLDLDHVPADLQAYRVAVKEAIASIGEAE